MIEREFTLDDARELVPWLVDIFNALAGPRAKARQLRIAMRAISSKVGANGHGSSHGQLQRLQDALQEVSAEIDAGVLDIHERGILLKGVEPGLVDFPHVRDGRKVYLCWREGESGIEFWHDVDSGFAGRLPL